VPGILSVSMHDVLPTIDDRHVRASSSEQARCCGVVVDTSMDVSLGRLSLRAPSSFSSAPDDDSGNDVEMPRFVLAIDRGRRS
jgi:hypothetical protein